MRSQEDKLDAVITEAVLNRQVSNVLCRAAERLMADEMFTFSSALECLEPLNISFWLSGNSDMQFWLDKQRYFKAKQLTSNITSLEASEASENEEKLTNLRSELEVVKLMKSADQPYASSLKVVKSIKDVPSLHAFKELIKYAWGKVSTEA